MDLTPNESTEISFQQKCHTEVQWKEKSYHPGQWFSKYIIQKCFRGFPGGAVVENLPANAGDMGSSPGLGRSHMPRSNWAREPQLLSLRVWSLCSTQQERPR